MVQIYFLTHLVRIRGASVIYVSRNDIVAVERACLDNHGLDVLPSSIRRVRRRVHGGVTKLLMKLSVLNLVRPR